MTWTSCLLVTLAHGRMPAYAYPFQSVEKMSWSCQNLILFELNNAPSCSSWVVLRYEQKGINKIINETLIYRSHIVQINI